MNHLEVPIEYRKVFSISKYKSELCRLILHQEITLIIDLFNDEDNHIHQIVRKIEGDEYQNWGSDDSYIDTIIQNKINKMRSS